MSLVSYRRALTDEIVALDRIAPRTPRIEERLAQLVRDVNDVDRRLERRSKFINRVRRLFRKDTPA